jgi:lariat debranching enzyme
MLTYDWPSQIYEIPGSIDYLLKKKPSLKDEIKKNSLGSPMYKLLLKRLRPKYWFSSHLDLRFQTIYVHQETDNNLNNLDRSTFKETNEKLDDKKKPEITHFLALDKCMPKRKYLEILNVKSDHYDLSGLEYDLEWLSILKATDEYVSIQEHPFKLLPQPYLKVNYDFDEYKDKIKKVFKDNFKIPKIFSVNLPFNQAGEDLDPDRKINYVNEQTSRFCKLLEITDPLQRIVNRLEGKVENPDKIDIDDCEDLDWIETNSTKNNVNQGYDDENTNMLAIECQTIKQERALDLIENDYEMNNSREMVIANNIEQIDDSIREPSKKRIKKENLYFFDRIGDK